MTRSREDDEIIKCCVVVRGKRLEIARAMYPAPPYRTKISELTIIIDLVIYRRQRF